MRYHEDQRYLQDAFDTRRLADRLDERIVHPSIAEEDKAFIESRDMFFLATVDAKGFPNCSYKGGDPGFVRVVDPNTIVFPNYDGNGMFLSMGNIRQTHHVGMLFIDWEEPDRLRLNGEALIETESPLLAGFPAAQFLVRVHVREIFPNCGRYIHQLKLVKRSAFVPRKNAITPIPDWKRMDAYVDVLPTNDPARP
ncbi:MAG TPA: pyridoxamine 5'-phosphate oxidase family protein [Candidatus Eremiobacteraceae bacterium]|nr:pyridoxamine 5'-phosphate oxidase family protein [Candidatus Eremiobacteraceae bacterium]